MFLGKLFKSSQKNTSLILDLGSGSVGGALVQAGESNANIMHSIRIPIGVSSDSSYEKLSSALINITEEVVKSLVHEGHSLHTGKLQEAHCFLASPWYGSRVSHSIINSPEPVTVTEPFLRDALSKEVGKNTFNLNQIEKEYLLSGKLNALENKVLNITLNGYEIKNPYGKKARTIETDSYISFSSAELIKKIEEIIFTYTHTHTSYKSFMLSLFYFVREFFSQETDYALFDLTGEMTDIAFISKGKIIHTESVLFGRNTILRKISNAFSVGPDLALSFVRLYSQGQMEEGTASRITEIMTEIEKEWSEAFSRIPQDGAVLKLQKHYNRAFIVSDEGIGSVFAKFLVSSNCIKKEQSAILLGENSLRQLTHVEGLSVDPFLIIESSYIHRKN